MKPDAEIGMIEPGVRQPAASEPALVAEVVEPAVRPDVRTTDRLSAPALEIGHTGMDDRRNGHGDRNSPGDGNGHGGSGGGRGRGGGDGTPARPSAEPTGAGANLLGMQIFIASEAVLFLTLIVAFAVVRAGYPAWPPSEQPRLPVTVSFLNTLVLLGSGAAVFCAWRAIRRGLVSSAGQLSMVSASLGILFLVVQGVEWIRLIDFGLTVTRNIYGAVFYVVIGMHALHVFVAVLGLLYVVRRFRKGAYTREAHEELTMACLFWGFVVVIWPVLFVFVYLL